MTSWRTDTLPAFTRASAPQRFTSRYIGTHIGLVLDNLVGYFLRKIGIATSNPGEIPWGNIIRWN